MKVRNGFVTNSSSSSFILAYNNSDYEMSIWHQLVDVYGCTLAGVYFGNIMNFLSEKENLKDNEEFKSDLLEDFYDKEFFNYQEELERSGKNYEEVRNITNSEEGAKIIRKRANESVQKLLELFDDFDTVKEIKISDDYELSSILEDKVVESLKECKQVISNH